MAHGVEKTSTYIYWLVREYVEGYRYGRSARDLFGRDKDEWIRSERPSGDLERDASTVPTFSYVLISENEG